MKRILALTTLLSLAASVACAQTVLVTSTQLTDSAGNPYTGAVYFQPTVSNGQPTAYRKGGGGTVMSSPVRVAVSAGVFTVSLPDTTLTYPANICFMLTAPNLAAGYQCLQPHATPSGSGDWCQSGGCNLDNYLPNLSPQLPTTATTSINNLTGAITFAGSGMTQVGNTFTFNGGSGGSIGDSDVVGQTASQSTVNLVGTVPATGKYRISYYANQNAVCATGSVSAVLTFVWMDASSPRTAKSIALTLGTSQSSNAGSIQGIIPVYAVAASAITYTSTVTGSCATGGPSSYDAHISVEAVQ